MKVFPFVYMLYCLIGCSNENNQFKDITTEI